MSTIRDYLEPLGVGKRANGMPLTGEYFPIPLRVAPRIGLRLLALLTAEASAGTDPVRGDNAIRCYAEEIIECYMAGTFSPDECFSAKVGVPLRVAFHAVVELMKAGFSEDAACRKYLAQLRGEGDSENVCPARHVNGRDHGAGAYDVRARGTTQRSTAEPVHSGALVP